MSNSLMTVPKELEKVTFDVAVRSEFFTGMIGRVLSNPTDREQFVQDLIISVNNDPSLLRCEKLSLVSGGLQAKQYNLRIGDASGHAYLVPYNDRKSGTTKAQFQIGYKGLVQLALRSGKYVKINVVDVREGELEYIDYLMEEHRFKWLMPEVRKNKPVIGYAAVVVEKSGFSKILYATKEEIEAHAGKYSQAYKGSNSSPWTTEFDKMAKKTVLKLLLGTYGHVTPELEALIQADQAVVGYDDEGNPVYEYVDSDSQPFKNKTTGKDVFEAEANETTVIEEGPEEPEVETTVVEDVKETTLPTTTKAPTPSGGNKDKVKDKDDDEEPVISQESKDKLAALRAKRGRPSKAEGEATTTEPKPEVKTAPTAKTETKAPTPKPEVVVTATPEPQPTGKVSHADKLAALRAKWKN